ncbi:hypothetical protein [Runella sp.]|uniref:hypothetical protein n=1 Tax=Runella sp. TaxID=1960881 RepID=UPI003D0FB2D4
MSVYQARTRGPFTQQVSLKIGATLEKYFMQLHAESGYPLNTMGVKPLYPMASETDNESEQTEARLFQFEQRLTGLARISMITAILACIAVFIIGCLGLVMSVFSRRVRQRWKWWLGLAAGGTGFIGMVSRALGKLPTFLRR